MRWNHPRDESNRSLWSRLGLGFRAVAEPRPQGAVSRDRAQPVWKPGDIVASILTDPGCHRPLNEDFGCLVLPEDPERFHSKGALAAVADGMGGHQSGEVASRTAIETLERVYYESDRDIPDALDHAFRQANRAVWKRSGQEERLRGMGATCTALVLSEGLAWVAHAGDSRLYLVRAGSMLRMTEDHSLVMDLVRKGMLTAEEASRHEDRNVISRALGTKPEIEISTWSEPLPVRAGDRFVLCSDGLYDLVTEIEIQNITQAADPKTACEILVRAARDRGGYDNITVAVVGVLPDETPRSAGMRETRESEVAR